MMCDLNLEFNIMLLDLLLVPSSVCLATLYHAYLWHHNHSSSKGRISSNSQLTSPGKKAWFEKISKEKERGGNILGAQSFRNSLMSAILTATVSVILNAAVAAMANNVFTAGRTLHFPLFGMESGGVVLLKYMTASVLLMTSFTFNSMSVGIINDANFLFSSDDVFRCHAEAMVEKGSRLGSAGNRVFLMSFPFLMWLFGPVALALSTVVLVFVLYNLDFR